MAAENVPLSDTETIKRLLAPIVALELPVLGAISDAQVSLLQAIASLWPAIPQQVCQFHYLREASRPSYEVDRAVRTQVRKAIQQPVRDVRRQLERHRAKLASQEPSEASTATQLEVLDDYALAVQTALNLDGQQPRTTPAWLLTTR